jgi:hypothetical protein
LPTPEAADPALIIAYANTCNRETTRFNKKWMHACQIVKGTYINIPSFSSPNFDGKNSTRAGRHVLNVVQQISPGKQKLIELPIPFKLRENYPGTYRLTFGS